MCQLVTPRPATASGAVCLQACRCFSAGWLQAAVHVSAAEQLAGRGSCSAKHIQGLWARAAHLISIIFGVPAAAILAVVFTSHQHASEASSSNFLAGLSFSTAAAVGATLFWGQSATSKHWRDRAATVCLLKALTLSIAGAAAAALVCLSWATAVLSMLVILPLVASVKPCPTWRQRNIMVAMCLVACLASPAIVASWVPQRHWLGTVSSMAVLGLIGPVFTCCTLILNCFLS